jgi:uncharacterized membrane protein (DUF4010 family)
MIDSLFIGFFLSLILGAIIGAQREMTLQKFKKSDFAGFRTYTLITMLGFLLGYLSFVRLDEVYIAIVGIVGIFAFSLVAYKQVSVRGKDVSIISEVSAVVMFIVGILVSLQEYYFSIIITFILTSLVAVGNQLHSFAKKLTTNEVFASLKFALISIIVLPLLPNRNYSLYEMGFLKDMLLHFGLSEQFLLAMNVFNPFEIWLMVVFVSGIAFIGYILMRTIGAQKGSIYTGFLGGLMSSTALTSSFAIESKRLPFAITPLAVGVIIACSVMFFRILFTVSVLFPSLVKSLFIPMIVMGSVGLIMAFFIFKKQKVDHKQEFKVETPFALKPAFFFGGFYIGIIFLAQAMLYFFGESGVLLVAFLSGIADVDAITISLARLAGDQVISSNLAVLGIVIAAFSNTVVKAGIAYSLGAKKFAKIIFVVFGTMILAGALSLLFI